MRKSIGVTVVLAMLAAAGAARAESLVVCYDKDDFKPFNYHEAGGQLAGLHVDLANALCSQMSATCKPSEDEFGHLIDDLRQKKCDFLVAFMGWSAEREKLIDYTDPYYRSRFVYTAPAGKGIKVTKETFAGKTIVTQGGTLWETYARQDAGDFAKFLLPTKYNEILDDLVAGKADAMMSDAFSAYEFLKSPDGAKFEIVGTLNLPARTGEAYLQVRKGDPLKGRLNEALAKIRQDGTYRNISNKYLPLILQ